MLKNIKKRIMDKCEIILKWAENKTWFDTKFVEDMNIKIYLTERQEQAVDNIYYKFKIDEWINNPK